jgi:rubredoxin
MHWKCSVCNFIWEGEAPPTQCPKCGVPGEKYAQLTEDQVNVVERSRFTNGLYAQLLTVLPDLQELARQGIEDDLDARCVTIFERLLAETSFLEKSIKAEINGHVMRGKWG